MHLANWEVSASRMYQGLKWSCAPHGPTVSATPAPLAVTGRDSIIEERACSSHQMAGSLGLNLKRGSSRPRSTSFSAPSHELAEWPCGTRLTSEIQFLCLKLGIWKSQDSRRSYALQAWYLAHSRSFRKVTLLLCLDLPEGNEVERFA